MSIKITNYKDHKIVEITNSVGFSVTLFSYGASIYKICDGDAVLTQSPKDIKELLTTVGYFGKTVGPITNRVKEGKVNISGKVYNIDCNEKPNSLHSGKHGISNKDFGLEYSKENKRKIEVLFTLNTLDMENGLPGNILYKVKYVISQKSIQISVYFEAISDKTTIMGMTNHSYFNLGVDDTKLTLKMGSKYYLNAGKNDLLPISKEPVNDLLDFRKGKLISLDVDNPKIKKGKANGYDHQMYLPKFNNKIELYSDARLLRINSNFNAVQIYSDNYETPFKTFNQVTKIRRGIAIEPQDDILNRIIIKPNQKYKRYIKYTFVRR